MVVYEFTKGIQGFKESVKRLFKNDNTKLFIYFIGEMNDKGLSWCPDCNKADPFVQAAVKKFGGEKDIFLTVDVGDRKIWKDKKNPFREDPKLKLTTIPTIIRWNTVLRLEDKKCNDPGQLEMLFTEE